MDFDILKGKYNLESVTKKKEDLESKMSLGHSSGENMSVLSADLSYYSTLHSLISQLYKAINTHDEALEILNTPTDEQLKDLAQADIDSSKENIERIAQELLEIEVEREFSDPDDSKAVILEIRGGAGGEEAALFASDLFRMYKMFSNSKGWEIEIIDSNVSESGGFKSVIAHIKGKNIFKTFKYESGVHRVQRIPSTESSGRVHTSTASVAILPEAKEVDISIDPQDLKIEVMRAGGAGGQCVNRTDSAVRITHVPSGIVVSCQETKYQDQNKVKAMNILRARLYERQKALEDEQRSKARSSQIGTAMRAEKIRTYNFPQNRVTDHRIKKSWFNIEGIMNGNIEEMLEIIQKSIQKGIVFNEKDE